MRHNLGTRLTLSFLVAIVATAGLVVLLANLITTNRFTLMAAFAGQRTARRLAPFFAQYYARTGGWDGVEALMQDDRLPPAPAHPMPGEGGWRMPGRLEADDERLLLLDPGGQIIADSDPEAAPVRLPSASTDRGASILVDGQHVGTLIAVSGLGLLSDFQSAILRQVNGLMLAAAVLAALAVLVVSALQTRRIVAPVRALAAAARRVAGGDLSQRVPVTSQDELGEMAVAFNTMAADLERQHELRHRAMADIAHELRTPLSVLQIDLESIEDGLTQPSSEVIAGLQASVAHLHRLIEDLRVLSLADAGELPMEAEPVELNRLVQDIVERVRGMARARDITLRVQLPGTPLTVVGDDQRLAQVLLNLLSNALQHTPPDGQITVSARQAVSACQVGEGEVHVRVQDTGEGIPARDLPHIFERFYRPRPFSQGDADRPDADRPDTDRPDRARSRGTGGSGLGLSITRSLIEAHGGCIWAESVEGEGAAFTFALPQSPPAAQEPAVELP